MLPTENRWTKKRKAEEEAAIVPPANVVMQFQSDDGVKAGAYHALFCVCLVFRFVKAACSIDIVPAGPQLSVQHDVTVKQLNLLLNQLLSNDEALPYSFFIEDQELASNVGEHLQKNKVRPCWHTHTAQLHTVNLPRHSSHHTKPIHAGHIDKPLTTHLTT